MISEVVLSGRGHVGIVVRDIDAAMERYWRILRIGPWGVHTNSAPPIKCLYRGRPASYRVKVANARVGPLTVELIQYLGGDTIHGDFVASRGEGIEHLGVYVSNLDDALAPFTQQGIAVLQSAEGTGASRDGRYVYLDTEATLGCILELVQSASRGLPTERIYPDAPLSSQ